MCDTFGPLRKAARRRFLLLKEFYQAGEPQKSEDCLYQCGLAAGKSDAKLPVMLWIHGGAFMNGYGYETEFDGEAIADVILVTSTTASACVASFLIVTPGRTADGVAVTMAFDNWLLYAG